MPLLHNTDTHDYGPAWTGSDHIAVNKKRKQEREHQHEHSDLKYPYLLARGLTGFSVMNK